MSLKSAAYFLGTHLPFVMMYFYILEDSLYLFIYLQASAENMKSFCFSFCIFSHVSFTAIQSKYAPYCIVVCGLNKFRLEKLLNCTHNR